MPTQTESIKMRWCRRRYSHSPPAARNTDRCHDGSVTVAAQQQALPACTGGPELNDVSSMMQTASSSIIMTLSSSYTLLPTDLQTPGWRYRNAEKWHISSLPCTSCAFHGFFPVRANAVTPLYLLPTHWLLAKPFGCEWVLHDEYHAVLSSWSIIWK